MHNPLPFNVDRPSCPYKQEELWLPLSLVVEEWGATFHELLCSDKIRVTAYQAAIDRVVTEFLIHTKTKATLRIMDVGAGSGILSELAICAWGGLYRAGDTRARLEIVAVEANEKVAQRAAGRLARKRALFEPAVREALTIRVVPESSYELCADPLGYGLDRGSIDILLCEMMGNLGDNEDMVSVLRDMAATFLAPDGATLPTRLNHYLVPITSEALWSDIHTNNVQAISSDISDALRANLREDSTLPYYDVIIPDRCHISERPILTGEFDFRAPATLSEEYVRQIEFKVSKSAVMHGFKSFFSAELCSNILLDTGEGTSMGIPPRGALAVGWDYSLRRVSDCWKHGFIPLEAPRRVEAGEHLAISYSRFVSRTGFSYRIAGTSISGSFEQRVRFPRPVAVQGCLTNSSARKRMST
jgi:protein arginine N-methyltransferase 1